MNSTASAQETPLRVARFEKVSPARFVQDFSPLFGDGGAQALSALRLPRRATTGSAGYDFFSPAAFSLVPGESVTLPTGVRVWMQPGWVLQIFPRSGLGFRYRLRLDNTVGIIDQDYYFSDNEGHILCKLTNCGEKPLALAAGDAFAQGVFLPFGVTEDDCARDTRNGGFGSTGR
ncbi:MAG: deoxyuridine 5'-triphosphate nucleotidohydrolase [Oscillospiraceae bacterium]|nr:deoxyuridine 5'-triphosphate nucleotidohydrolase [Oscillospiraceae bacterium]